MSRQHVISLISLGCPKNTVDSERILGMFVQQGWLLAEVPEAADICLVNTCGFIENARLEARQVLEELDGLKRKGRPLVVALGCLVEHAEKHGLETFLAKADYCAGFKDYLCLPQICDRLLGDAKKIEHSEVDIGFMDMPRLITGSGHSVSLKISEGCSNMCSFCAIPGIRGCQVSRPMEWVLREAQQLVDSGARELNIIAQDTSAYGLDLYQEHRLGDLLRELSKLDYDGWFRLMYVYPVNLKEDVLDVLASDPRFCPYIDIPLQHISDGILRSMNRRISKADVMLLLDRIRTRIDDVALRTAFIVGYPGERDEQFAELVDFVRAQQFDHMGVFTYSPEPGTAARELADEVEPTLKQERMDCLMQIQSDISAAKLQRRCGSVVPVMLDGIRSFQNDADEEIELLVGHTQRQAIDIDGCVILDADRLAAEPGCVLDVTVSGSTEYDLIGTVQDESC